MAEAADLALLVHGVRRDLHSTDGKHLTIVAAGQTQRLRMSEFKLLDHILLVDSKLLELRSIALVSLEGSLLYVTHPRLRQYRYASCYVELDGGLGGK